MMIYVKKELSAELQSQGYKPVSEDVTYDIFRFEKQLPSCFSALDKSGYMIANSMTFVKGTL